MVVFRIIGLWLKRVELRLIQSMIQFTSCSGESNYIVATREALKKL